MSGADHYMALTAELAVARQELVNANAECEAKLEKLRLERDAIHEELMESRGNEDSLRQSLADTQQAYRTLQVELDASMSNLATLRERLASVIDRADRY